jgi:dTDP-4-dehydrorhamnose reductase
MSRILVLGARGLLGRDLTEVLRSSSEGEVVPWDLGEIDIREETKTVKKIGELRPDVIVNAAALTRVDDCESQTEQAFAVNAEGMKHVALAALRCQARVVYLSTDYIFDGEKREPYLEDDPPHPLNAYGRSKWKGEEYAQTLLKDWLIVRTQWLYGKHGKNFVTSILEQAREKDELRIVDDQVGSPTYSVDLSKILSTLIQKKAEGVFHATNSGACSWYEFGKAILQLSGLDKIRVFPISSQDTRRPAVRPSYSVLSCQKLTSTTGATPRPWIDALRDYLESLKQ